MKTPSREELVEEIEMELARDELRRQEEEARRKERLPHILGNRKTRRRIEAQVRKLK